MAHNIPAPALHGFHKSHSLHKASAECQTEEEVTPVLLQFARSYSQWTEDDWRKVVFSNESKFMIGLGY